MGKSLGTAGGKAIRKVGNLVKETGGDPYGSVMDKPGLDAFGLFTPEEKKDPPPAPVVKAPTVMPDQEAIVKNKKKSIAEQLQRRGRASTILTDSNDTLGG